MTLFEAAQTGNYDEADGIEMDGIWYNILDIIDGYYYLMDLDNKNNFLLMKEDGEELVSVTDEDEYAKVLSIFASKHPDLRK